MDTTRTANAVWRGDLLNGEGTVSGATGLFTDLPTSWASRTEAPAGRTSPEELPAAAHASCYSMAFSNGLAKAGFPAERVDVRADVTFTKAIPAGASTRSALTIRARVPGIPREATFQEAAKVLGPAAPYRARLTRPLRSPSTPN